nr:zinc finger protein 2 [Drosophila kikkawai]
MDSTDINLNISTSSSCRACLGVDEANTSLCLYDEIEYNGINMELWQLLLFVSKVKMAEDPNLPAQICQTCAQRLISAYEFILDVENSEKKLQSLSLPQAEAAATKPDEGHVEVVELIDQEEVIDMEDFLPAGYEEQQATLGELTEAPKCDVEDQQLYAVADPDSETEIKEDEVNADDGQLGVPPNQHEITLPPAGSSRLGSRLTHSSNFMYKCDICPRVFAKSESLRRHFDLAHRKTADMAAQELADESSGTGLLTCEHCPRTFKRQDTLRRHMLAFHPDAPLASGPEMEDTSPRKRVAKRRDCPHCGLSFPASSLTIHIRRHTGDNPYKCTQCEKAYPRSQDLTLHMRQHTGERPSQCKICSKKFISQNKLARHMRLHTGQRPYVCDKCNKGFVQSNDLKIHMRRHTGERPYHCGVCGDSFVCGSLLTIHRNQMGHYEVGHKETGAEGSNLNDPYVNARVSKRRAEDIERMRLQRATEDQIQQPMEVTYQQKSPPILSYKCGVCEMNFKSGALLTIHRNNMAHYEIGKVDYGDPFGEKQKRVK